VWPGETQFSDCFDVLGENSDILDEKVLFCDANKSVLDVGCVQQERRDRCASVCVAVCAMSAGTGWVVGFVRVR
jgi:hypothetical protein